MTPIEIIAAAHVAATLLVGAVHAVLILVGLRAMRRASDARDRALDAQERALAAREHAADQRHAEAMQALREQGAALREQGEALREQGAALRASTAALVTLLDRTGRRLTIAHRRHGPAPSGPSPPFPPETAHDRVRDRHPRRDRGGVEAGAGVPAGRSGRFPGFPRRNQGRRNYILSD